jgi:hypothetical protein
MTNHQPTAANQTQPTARYCRYWFKLHSLVACPLPSPALPLLLRTLEEVLQVRLEAVGWFAVVGGPAVALPLLLRTLQRVLQSSLVGGGWVVAVVGSPGVALPLLLRTLKRVLQVRLGAVGWLRGLGLVWGGVDG